MNTLLKLNFLSNEMSAKHEYESILMITISYIVNSKKIAATLITNYID